MSERALRVFRWSPDAAERWQAYRVAVGPETTVLDARTRHLAAIQDQRVAAAVLELASGALTPDSPVLNERTR